VPNFSGMREDKIQNFSILLLLIFNDNENYERTACHQQTLLEIMYSVANGKPSYGVMPLKLKKRKATTLLYSFIHTHAHIITLNMKC
jgi:hypothetical protein